jgi:hypothetical protein
MGKKVLKEKKFRFIIEGTYRSSDTALSKRLLDRAGDAVDKVLNYNGESHITDIVRVTLEDPTEIILNRWCIEDVISRAQERHIRISQKVAKKILAEMEHRFDAMQGINWDVIDCYIDSRND